VNNLADKEPSVGQTISTVPQARLQDQVIPGNGTGGLNNPANKEPSVG
jgi:hypothetical protein